MASRGKIIPFSHLALGGKFKYVPSISESLFVKISNDRMGGCIASWDEKLITANWVSQGIYSLNDTGKDIDIEVIE